MNVPAAILDAKTDLADLDAACRDAFAGLIEQLSIIRSNGERLTNYLEGLAELGTRNKGVGEARGFLSAIRRSRIAFEDASGFESVRAVQQAGFSMRQQMKIVHRRGSLLWAVSSRFRSTAAELNLSTFDNYAMGLREVAHALIETSQSVLTQIDEVETSELASIASAARAAEGLRSLSDKIQEPLERTRVLVRGMVKTGEGLAATTGEPKRNLQNAIVDLIGIFQFSDELAQRLDHVGQIHDRGPALGKLAAAHLRALGADLDTIRNDAMQRLMRLAHVATEAGELVNADGYSLDTLNAVEFQRATLDSTIQHSELVKNATSDAEENIRMLQAAMDAALASLETLREIYQQVTQASHTSMVMAAREGGAARGALTVLSTAVNDAAEDCVVAFERAERNLRDLQGASTTRFERVYEELAVWTQTLATAFGDLSEIESGLTQLNAMIEDNRTVQDDFAYAVSGAMNIVARLSGLPERANELANLVDQDTVPPAQAMEEIRAIYSMESERILHDEIAEGHNPAGRMSGTQKEPPAIPETQDIGDIFF